MSDNALLFGGGGSRGAVEIGLYKALRERGICIQRVFGSSIGAINGAFIAAGWTPEELGELWSRLEGTQLFPRDWSFLWKGLRATGLYRTDRLVRFLESHLPVQRFEELKTPLVVTATNLLSGHPVYLDSGELLPALLASSALPPYFPAVRHRGLHLIDGGIVANIPIGEAIARGAGCIFALLCHCGRELARPPQGFVEVEARAFRIAVEKQLRHDLEHYRDQAKLVVLEPCFDFPPSPLRVEKVQPLIRQGYEYAKAELARHGVGATGAQALGPAR